MGFDFIVIARLLPSHCGFSFVFGCGVSFLVSSSVFLLMIVQQLVVILVLLQEGVSTRPSTLPSLTSLSGLICSCLSSFLRWKLRCFLPSCALAATHKFWQMLFSFLLSSKHFLIFLLISFFFFFEFYFIYFYTGGSC